MSYRCWRCYRSQYYYFECDCYQATKANKKPLIVKLLNVARCIVATKQLFSYTVYPFYQWQVNTMILGIKVELLLFGISTICSLSFQQQQPQFLDWSIQQNYQQNYGKEILKHRNKLKRQLNKNMKIQSDGYKKINYFLEKFANCWFFIISSYDYNVYILSLFEKQIDKILLEQIMLYTTVTLACIFLVGICYLMCYPQIPIKLQVQDAYYDEQGKLKIHYS